jgi:hypothetical protein
MTVRRSSRRVGSLDAVLAALPDRFRNAEVYHDHGLMTGLLAYICDLGKHLWRELASRRRGPADRRGLTALGIPPSEWYRAVLTKVPRDR